MTSEHKNVDKKRFITGIKYSIAVNIASKGMMYLSQFLLARMMKVDQYGIYVYSLAWLNMLLLMGTMGLDTALLRYIPQYVSRNEWGLCWGIIKRSYQLVFLVSVVLLLSAWVVILLNRNNLDEENLILALLIGMGVLPLWTAIRLTQGLFQSFKRPGFSQFLDGVLAPALLLAILGMAIMLNIPVSAVTVMAVFAVTCFLVLLFGLTWLRSNVYPARLKTAEPQYKTREWIMFAAPMLFIAGTHMIMNNTDVVMIGMMKDPSQAGIYSAAVRTASLITVSLVFVNMAITPYISEYFHSERHAELQHFISLSARIAVYFTVPTFLILMIFGKQVLGLFGHEFKSGYYSLLILSAGQLVNVLSGSVGYIMIMAGKQKQIAYLFAVSATLNIMMNFMLIPQYGIEGAAVATAVSMMLWNLTLVVYIRRKIKLDSTIFSIWSGGTTADKR